MGDVADVLHNDHDDNAEEHGGTADGILNALEERKLSYGLCRPIRGQGNALSVLLIH